MTTIPFTSDPTFTIRAHHIPPELLALDVYFAAERRLAETWRGMSKRQRAHYHGGFTTFRARTYATLGTLLVDDVPG